MKIVRTVADLRAALAGSRGAGKTIGFVPTMGWFHEGHLSLMSRARADCDVVVVSLFVNPAQFNDPKDLQAYPRDEARDARMAEGERVDVLFAPDAKEVYPDGHTTTVTVGAIAAPLEGQSRGASHFAGVATVVAKLFNMVQPTVAYFGQKDAQQALVIQQMVRDLTFRFESRSVRRCANRTVWRCRAATYGSRTSIVPERWRCARAWMRRWRR